MAAPQQNKNAEKWTLQKTLAVLEQIEIFSCSSDCLYLGAALSMANVYSDVWAYWKRKWVRNPAIISRMKQIMQRFEVRLFEKMARKEMPAQVAMFALRHHYGWGKEEKPKDFDDLIDEDRVATPEQLAEIEVAEALKVEQEAPKGMAINRYMVDQYNKANPTNPILPPAVYFKGEPQSGIPAIPYDGGYFMRMNL